MDQKGSEMKKQSRIAFCIPVYNEEKMVPTIEANVKLIAKATTRAKIIISDNNSTDKTYEKLLRLKDKFHDLVVLFRQQSNIGFSKNISFFGSRKFLKEQKNIKFFQFLGADDRITKNGLRHLLRNIAENSNADLIISNWVYCQKDKKGNFYFYTDVDANQRSISSLQSFFNRRSFIPGGIMQYCINKKRIRSLENHKSAISPHVGVFFDCFPGKVIIAGPPGLCEVEKLTSKGWRSDPRSVLETHLKCFAYYVKLINAAYHKGLINLHTAEFTTKKYTRLTKDILEDCLNDVWGFWEPKQFDRIENLLYLIKGFCLGSLKNVLSNLRFLQKQACENKIKLIKKATKQNRKNALK
jgi:glycosyltransferase involved in cell wall biosynthesis